MILIPIVCTGLGIWQFKRRKWKLGLLQQVKPVINIQRLYYHKCLKLPTCKLIDQIVDSY